ncbi:hypothetical protein BGP84_09915 [Pseudomonas putida]|jgi:hypothetical protein|uniref:DUF3077 domain-containing protein n=1 Tax=Pseudomonas putida TaxID=303 RepID=A0A2S3X363_PSEPU|nr:hypothetical protein BGP84_09915 [Pseudomonas putida]POG16169.1 hypothetical protein BGP85_08410 [Pseudomonas putida]
MLQINTPSSSSDNSSRPSQRLLTAIPGIPTTQAKEQTSKLLDCARYLHTGVMLGDHRSVAASHYLNMMVRALFDELEHSRPHSRSQADR